jgi:hypothetical protein
MIRTFFGALSVMIAISACSSIASPANEARAACDVEARDAVETAGVRADQRPDWVEEYARQCMAKKGF